ncbi:MAG: pyridoxamine 5'-phosphate oxidase family protein [Paludibacter sp.]|nr:pyridoxamine 5'-phosphate oxidase family protein [Paludibacter sp.]
MKNPIQLKEYVREVIRANRFAVLATEGDGQPYASLIAITPVDEYLILIFATYRNTRKYNNLVKNGKVAILFENRSIKSKSEKEVSVLTAFGQAEEVLIGNAKQDLLAHLQKHPELSTFLLSTDCAVFRVKVEAYQVVHGIEDVKWWKINEMEVLS